MVLLVPLLILAATLGNHFNYQIVKRWLLNRIEHSHNQFVQKHLVKSILRTRVFYQKYGKKWDNLVVFSCNSYLYSFFLPELLISIILFSKLLYIDWIYCMGLPAHTFRIFLRRDSLDKR